MVSENVLFFNYKGDFVLETNQNKVYDRFYQDYDTELALEKYGIFVIENTYYKLDGSIAFVSKYRHNLPFNLDGKAKVSKGYGKGWKFINTKGERVK